MTRYRINPGEFRNVITFQNRSIEQDSYGEESENWLDFKTIRGAIYPISGKEFFAAETVNSEITHKINMRYVPGITPNMRVKFGDRIFSIISLINFQEKNIEIQVLCKEVV